MLASRDSVFGRDLSKVDVPSRGEFDLSLHTLPRLSLFLFSSFYFSRSRFVASHRVLNQSRRSYASRIDTENRLREKSNARASRPPPPGVTFDIDFVVPLNVA